MKVAERQEAKLKEKVKEEQLRERQLEKLKQQVNTREWCTITCSLVLLFPQVKVTAERDPGRLLKPTASVREKGKGGHGSGLGGVVLVMPRRAVPSWRQT